MSTELTDPHAAPKRTFAELIASLAEADDELDALDFDSESLIEDLKDKVDSIHYVLEKLRSYKEFMKGQAAPYLKKAKTIEAAQDRLRKYVVFVMEARGFHMLPGHAMKATLRDSPAALVIDREPTAIDFSLHPEYVKMERRYVWNKDAIKDALTTAAADSFPEDIPARITRSKWVDFRVHVPEGIGRKGKRNAKVIDAVSSAAADGS